MRSARWSANYAKMEVNDYTVMQMVVGRLEARGYDMDYSAAYGHLVSKEMQKKAVYNVKQSQYNRARSSYYSTSTVGTLSFFP